MLSAARTGVRPGRARPKQGLAGPGRGRSATHLQQAILVEQVAALVNHAGRLQVYPGEVAALPPAGVLRRSGPPSQASMMYAPPIRVKNPKTLKMLKL